MKKLYKAINKAHTLENLLYKEYNKIYELLKNKNLQEFKKTKSYKDLVYISKLQNSKWVKISVDVQKLWELNPEFEIYFTSDSCKSIVDSIKSKNFNNIAKAFRNAYALFIVEYGIKDFDIPKDIAPLLIDEKYLEALSKDKEYLYKAINLISNVKKEIPSFIGFINVGWFDEPYMNGDVKCLSKLLKASIKMIDKWIKQEKEGKFSYVENSHVFHIPLSSGQSDSWDKWAYVIPNTLKYVCNFTPTG